MPDSEPAALLVDTDEKQVPEEPFVEVCPKCKGPVHDGFGLMFGGYGSYQFCADEKCGWATKHYEEIDDGNGRST